MRTDDSAALQTAAHDGRTDPLDALEFEQTTGKRAVYEEFEFTPAAGRVTVTNASHGTDDVEEHTYEVTVDDGLPASCSCPADEYHPGACKHRVAVALRPAVLEAAAPEPVVATDGGTEAVDVDDADADLEDFVDDDRDDHDDDRPEDCDCAPFLADGGLPCWPCYRDGFEAPNPDATEDDR